MGVQSCRKRRRCNTGSLHFVSRIDVKVCGGQPCSRFDAWAIWCLVIPEEREADSHVGADLVRDLVLGHCRRKGRTVESVKKDSKVAPCQGSMATTPHITLVTIFLRGSCAHARRKWWQATAVEIRRYLCQASKKMMLRCLCRSAKIGWIPLDR